MEPTDIWDMKAVMWHGMSCDIMCHDVTLTCHDVTLMCHFFDKLSQLSSVMGDFCSQSDSSRG
jgi:hypothetical protein